MSLKKKILAIFLILFVLVSFVFFLFFQSVFSPEKEVELPFNPPYNKDKLVVFFGYVGCPDVCPTTLKAIAEFRKEVNDSSLQVYFIGLTEDASPEATDKFAKFFDKENIGLKIEKKAKDRLIHDFNVFWSKAQKEVNRAPRHSSYIYFLKKESSGWVLKDIYTPYPADINALKETYVKIM